MEIYAAQIDSIDQNLGKLIAKLKELDQFENTMILFLSDNGCSSEGGPGGFNNGNEKAPIGAATTHASAGLEWANASNTPYRKHKISTFEGGTRTPFIVHWPAGITVKNQLRRQPGHVIDIMPTILAATGATCPEEHKGTVVKPPEGMNLILVFREDSVTPRDFFWEHQGNKAARRGDCKAVGSDKMQWQLYDLSQDLTETKDLSKENPNASPHSKPSGKPGPSAATSSDRAMIRLTLTALAEDRLSKPFRAVSNGSVGNNTRRRVYYPRFFVPPSSFDQFTACYLRAFLMHIK
jgi:arylsulfatase A-like enzyme